MSPSVNTRENRQFASETKFLVSPEVAVRIRRWVRGRLAPDPNAGGHAGDTYRVTSLYFDTAEFDVFQRNGSYGRSKYRVRRYGDADIVFLERKLKTRGAVTKRRSVVPASELARLERPAGPGSWCGDWFRGRLELRRLEPKCQIAYSRTARVAHTPHGPIRLTLDEDLRACAVARPAFSREPGTVLSGGFVIVEMKYLFALPALFKHLVEEFRLEARPFSKYRFAACKLGLAASPDFDRVEQAFREPVYA